MGQHTYKYTWRGHLIRGLSYMIRFLASVQATLIVKDGK